jgi:hypothetical protein
MLEKETIEYNGKTYYRYPKSNRRTDKVYFKKITKYLHREIWQDHNGKIPIGYHVHHIDGDTANNNIDNLCLLSAKEHHEKHPIKDIEKNKEHLERIRPLSKAWHCSPKGIEKHREIGAMAYKKFIPIPKICRVCGKEFMPKAVGNRDVQCSNNCKSKWRRLQGIDNIKKKCEFCDKIFETNKFKPNECCSKHCSISLRHKRNKQISV